MPRTTQSVIKARPPPKTKGGSSSDMFLTAAERRAKQQKDEKKSSEDPFSFLADVRDKDGVRPGEPGYDPRTLYVPQKAWKEFTPFERQVILFISLAWRFAYN